MAAWYGRGSLQIGAVISDLTVLMFDVGWKKLVHKRSIQRSTVMVL
jgi:hypothetical protein